MHFHTVFGICKRQIGPCVVVVIIIIIGDRPPFPSAGIVPDFGLPENAYTAIGTITPYAVQAEQVPACKRDAIRVEMEPKAYLIRPNIKPLIASMEIAVIDSDF